jgi:hypothetical protein
MKKEEIRHSKAMARKIADYAHSIEMAMVNIEHGSKTDLENVPVENIINRFQHDSGYGVLDYVQAIQQVVTDMIDELTSNKPLGD